MNKALSTANRTDQRYNFCKWKSPDKLDYKELLRKVMKLCTWEMWQLAWKYFTKESSDHCLKDKCYGDFSKGSWHCWNIKGKRTTSPGASLYTSSASCYKATFPPLVEND